MTECRSQGGVSAPISCGLIDGAVFAYLDNHPAANTKVPGDLEADVARNISDRLTPVAAVHASPSLSLYLTSAMDTLPSPGWVP
jgi:hypothetical protein